jgi:hypothetical protein
MTIVNDDSNVVSMWSSKPIDAAKVVIYNRNMFKRQAAGLQTRYQTRLRIHPLKIDTTILLMTLLLIILLITDFTYQWLYLKQFIKTYM